MTRAELPVDGERPARDRRRRHRPGARRDAGWALDLDALAARCGPRRGSSPSTSPTTRRGRCRTRRRGARRGVCERGIVLFADEVYRGLEPAGTDPLPQAADLSASAVSMGVMSKAYGLPGLRIGWLASRDRALLARLETRKHYTSICSAAPSELIATAALRRGPDRARATARSSTRTCRRSTRSSPAGRTGFAWERPQAGCVCFPRYLGATASRSSATTSSSRRAWCCSRLDLRLRAGRRAARPLPHRRRARDPEPRSRSAVSRSDDGARSSSSSAASWPGSRAPRTLDSAAWPPTATCSPTSSACGARWTSCSATCSAAGWRPGRRGGFSPAVDVYYSGDPPRAVVRADLAGHRRRRRSSSRSAAAS